jgi:hypothetical protein
VETENEIIKLFYTTCSLYRAHRGLQYPLEGSGHEEVNIKLASADVLESFQISTKHSFNLIEEGIRQLKALQPHCEKTYIMVGGGSAKGAMWTQSLTDLIAKYQMETPLRIRQIDGEYELVCPKPSNMLKQVTDTNKKKKTCEARSRSELCSGGGEVRC